MSKNEMIYNEIIAFHSGSYVEEIVEDLNITQAEFADRLGTTGKSLSKLINAEDSLTPVMALKLEKITGISTQTWLNIQASFDSKMIKIIEQKNRDEFYICENKDFSYFNKNNLFPYKKYSKEETVDRLRELLHFSDLTMLKDLIKLYPIETGQISRKKITLIQILC